jgi:UDP-N-acetylmuramoyl-tripeptide--D-alanyl-D-alanine ligase
MEMKSGMNNSTLIDDSWDATPESTISALETLAAISARRKIAVLGDIQNLAAQAIEAHRTIGEKAAEHTDILITVGPDMKHAQTSALESQFEVDEHHFQQSKDVGKWLTDYIRQDDLILIKGSRAMHMEEVIKRLIAK